ncbi:hypothetical protein K0M31_008633 [Melipona bicolor]|uniref:Secreted protein n=1 Tax=Melipona bicolor TaxID=60889 RepID=A0AA40FQ80_9HYME|nr:hypothetical protein K0M31_008633 [Melipona bicolor]
MKWCLVVLILAGVTRADNSVERDYAILTCPDLNSQEEIDLNEIVFVSLSVQCNLATVETMKSTSIRRIGQCVEDEAENLAVGKFREG